MGEFTHAVWENSLGYDVQQVHLITLPIEVVDGPVDHVLRFMRAVDRYEDTSILKRALVKIHVLHRCRLALLLGDLKGRTQEGSETLLMQQA